MEKNSNKNDMLALGIGFFLIAAILLITLSRNFSFFSKDSSSSLSAEEEQEIKIKSKQITVRELSEKIKNGESFKLIDIRSQEEYRKAHILDATHISIEELSTQIASWEKNKEYILIDNGQEMVENIVLEMIKQDFTQVKYVLGGFFSWKENFYPVVSQGDPLSFSDQAKVKYINTEELRVLLEKKEDIFLVDVRKYNSFQEGHIPSAVNIFLEDLEKNRNKIPRGKKIILYDNDGLWAFQGVVRLFDMGIFNTQALSDGFIKWKEKSYPLEK